MHSKRTKADRIRSVSCSPRHQKQTKTHELMAYYGLVSAHRDHSVRSSFNTHHQNDAQTDLSIRIYNKPISGKKAWKIHGKAGRKTRTCVIFISEKQVGPGFRSEVKSREMMKMSKYLRYIWENQTQVTHFIIVLWFIMLELQGSICI